MIASRDVDTYSINTDGRVCTLIDVCAVASTPVQFITNVTITSKKSWDVLATSIDTDVSKGTFVYVLAGLSFRSRDEAHVTFTAEASWLVQTVATLTQVAVLCALIAV